MSCHVMSRHIMQCRPLREFVSNADLGGEGNLGAGFVVGSITPARRHLQVDTGERLVYIRVDTGEWTYR